MPKDELWMQGQVQKFLRLKLGCKFASTNFNFQNIIFDVVGYEPENRIFHVVECKRSAKPAEIGHAFGQLLAYKSVLYATGYEFLNSYVKQPYANVDVGDLADSLAVRKLSAKFYVGLTDRACENVELLRVMKQSLSSVGIIRVKADGRCRNNIRIRGKRDYGLCESQTVSIPLQRIFSIPEFLRVVEERLRNSLSNESFADFRTRAVINKPFGDYRQFWYHKKAFHFEISVRKSRIEIMLHLESARKQNASMFRHLKNNERHIRASLGKQTELGRFGRKGWRRVREQIPINELNEDVLDNAVTRLSKYIETLQPMINDWTNQHTKLS